ncbi:hypothetical protein EV421DRAFT_1904301 [Armillaria borealis]|uniref:Uncharacterized protein n=1 Tax=Armillaria borealis TaxID=47425 RepID=A0AA39JGR0_9AGAR|nr:hypothetical protein EV421DRAFT_1904301 [Armillaria borealis]
MATQYFPRDYLVVSKIPVVPTGQTVAWELYHTRIGQGNGRTPFSGSFTIQHLSAQRHIITISATEGPDLYSSEHYKRSRWMVYSLFAQASRLSSSSSQNLRNIDRRIHNMKYVEVLCSWPMEFELRIRPCYDPFQLLDTFMADSDYAFALSLTVCEPRLDPQSNTVSWPVIHWYCDLDLSNEISMEEVEALFGVKVSIYARGDLYEVLKKQLSTIVEINTMCGFDPALEGADICEYFHLPRMEIFKDPVEVIPKYKFKRTTLPMPVDDHKDTTDVTPVTHIQAEKEPSTSHTQNQLIGILIALNVLLSLVIHYSITV